MHLYLKIEGIAPLPDPIPETPEPFPETPEPVPEIPEPVPETPEPVPETPEPVPETPEPVPETPEPVPETPEPVPETPEPEPAVPGCGENTVNAFGPGRIIGGAVATDHKYPWHVVVLPDECNKSVDGAKTISFFLSYLWWNACFFKCCLNCSSLLR